MTSPLRRAAAFALTAFVAVVGASCSRSAPAAPGPEAESASTELSGERLARLRAATVLILREGRSGTSSGSGFVVSRDADRALIVTNDHVVGGAASGALVSLRVVLRAGDSDEARVLARVERRDPENDLAIVSIPAEGAPAPLPIQPADGLRETQVLFVLGYPFGEALATAHRAPSVTVARSSVSALRRDDAGELRAIQLEGGIDPGKSGGPVVTAEGEVVGLVVAKIVSSNLGFAIPARLLAALVADGSRPSRDPGAADQPTSAAGALFGVSTRDDRGILPGDRVVRLPLPAVDAALAHDGRWLVLHLESKAGIAVADLDAGRLVGEVELTSAVFELAAGGDIALAAHARPPTIEVVDLSTFERTTRPSPFPDPVAALAMGAARGDRAVALTCPSMLAGSSRPCQLWELRPRGDASKIVPTGTARDRVTPEGSLSNRQGGGTCIRVDPSFKQISIWTVAATPNGVGIVSTRDGEWTSRYWHDGGWHLSTAADGFVYSIGPRVYHLAEHEPERLEGVGYGTALVASLTGPLVLAIAGDGTLSVTQRGTALAVGGFGRFPGWPRERWSPSIDPIAPARRTFTLDRRVFFDAARERISFLTPDGRALVIRPLDLGSLLDASGIPGLVVTTSPPEAASRGQRFGYAVHVVTGSPPVRFRLGAGPIGMSVSSLGTISWEVPDDAQGPVRVALIAMDATGREITHEFSLAVH